MYDGTSSGREAMTTKLEQALRSAGMTQADLAKGLGVRPATVSRYVGGVRCPNVVRARQIERLLGRRPGEIDWPGIAEEDEQAAAAGD